MKAVKSSIHEEQLDTRLGQNIELQLLGNSIDLKSTMSTLTRYMNKVNFISVHTALGDTDLCIETIHLDGNAELLRDTMSIANFIGMQTKRMIPVIIHCKLDMPTISIYEDIINENLHYISKLLAFYPFTSISIENLCPVIVIQNEMVNYSGYKFENVSLCEKLRSLAGNNRVFTTLDTCHAQISSNFYSILGNDSITLEDYFKNNAPYCNIVHIASGINVGLNKGEHGCGLTISDAKDFKRLINSYTPNAVKVFEITEDDYVNYDNCKSAIKLYESIKEDCYEDIHSELRSL